MTTTGEATASAPITPEPDSRRAETTYVILSQTLVEGQTKNELVWRIEASALLARTADAAVKAYVATLAADDVDDKGRVFVAVPTRSWKPVTVKPQTVTTLVIEEVA